MINSFSMLADEDKEDVKTNVDLYSLEEIESKLAVICVRKKVNFNLGAEEEEDAPAQELNKMINRTIVLIWIASITKAILSLHGLKLLKNIKKSINNYRRI